MSGQWPQLGVGAFVRHGEAILLVQRGQKPGKGLWAIPGGRVRPGESLRAAAEREVLEETGVNIEAGEQAWQFEYIQRDEAGELQYHYVVLDFHARYLSGEPMAADDVTAARWVPFTELAALPLQAETQKALRTLYSSYFEDTNA